MMLTRAFYDHFEYRITAALRRTSNRNRSHYFCDGVLEPELESVNLPAHVRRTQQLVLRAWIDSGLRKGGGSSVQEVYQLLLKLGPLSLAAYMHGQLLEPFVPAAEADDWVRLDLVNKSIEAQLP